MSIHIRLEVANYRSRLGEDLSVRGECEELKAGLKMTYTPECWFVEFDTTPAHINGTKYQYFSNVRDDVRKRTFGELECDQVIRDDWTPSRADPWFSSALNVMLSAGRQVQPQIMPAKFQQVIRVLVPYIQPHERVFICGSVKELGEWKAKSACEMFHIGDRVFSTEQLDLQPDTEYKFIVVHDSSFTNCTWESGENRVLGNATLVNAFFRYPYRPEPKFAGVNIPVFSINTKSSVGCGEFLDLKVLADFCQKAGLKVIQLLPVFDTINTKTWVDSYPYGAITVFGLHPMYISIGAIKGVTKKVLKKAEEYRQSLIKDPIEIQYEKVVEAKLEMMNRIYRHLIEENAESVMEEIKSWIASSVDIQYWIEGYCVFKYLADAFGTVDFNTWTSKEYYDNEKFLASTPEEKHTIIDNLFTNKDNILSSEEHKKLMFYAWMQMQLDTQLREAASYCREKGIILKGDVPIGVNRVSLDTWERTELFNMDTSTGAPPDAFSATGQNWGFPTYNWEKMAEDDYKWWSQRFKHMSRFFDAFRIDHVLGWFRIWEIPADCVKGNGRLGKFYPAMPIRFEWLEKIGIWDRKRLCEPWNKEDVVVGKLITEDDLDFLVKEQLISK